MEITNEIKATLFAQYLGSDIKTENDVAVMCGIDMFGVITTDTNTEWRIGDEEIKLILKPLSVISDEDAIEVLIQTGCWNKGELSGLDKEFKVIQGKMWVTNFELDFKNIYKGSSERVSGADAIMAYQFLQSRGYDLPQYLLNGTTLYESGLAIYK